MIRTQQGFVTLAFLCIATGMALGDDGQPCENLAPLASLSGRGTGLQGAVDGVKQSEQHRYWRNSL